MLIASNDVTSSASWAAISRLAARSIPVPSSNGTCTHRKVTSMNAAEPSMLLRSDATVYECRPYAAPSNAAAVSENTSTDSAIK
ncbi:MAG: hypothetical protein DME03_23835 [Candidatus Rokuibacteriota bacterium]|nr:MAG: hypothetical protein DME03_23835 [Candidatus Rokubacteria bacterium]